MADLTSEIMKRLKKTINCLWNCSAVRILRTRIVEMLAWALLFAVIFNGYIVVINRNMRIMTLTLNYSGIEEGLNPDGSKFNIFEMTSNDVLNRTVANLNIPNLTVDDLKDRIDIYAQGMQNITSRVKESIVNGKTYSYAPNEFTISYSQKSKLGKNSTHDVLEAMAKAYTDYFFENYVEKNNILDIDTEQFDGTEYIVVADMLEAKINSMIKYCENASKENSAFVSAETGKSFEDLKTTLDTLLSVEVEKYRSYVAKSALAVDREALLSMLEYTIENLSITFDKAYTRHNTMIDGINVYDQSVTKVVFIPSFDINDDFYMSRTKTGIDYLTTRASSYGLEAENIRKRIDYCQYLLDIYRAGPEPGGDYEAIRQRADELLADIETRLADISETAKITDNEYRDYKSKKYLEFKMPKTGLLSVISLGTFVKNCAAAFILAFLLVFIKTKLREYNAD